MRQFTILIALLAQSTFASDVYRGRGPNPSYEPPTADFLRAGSSALFRADAVASAFGFEDYTCAFFGDSRGGPNQTMATYFLYVGDASAGATSDVLLNQTSIYVAPSPICLLYGGSNGFAGFWDTIIINDPSLKPGDPLDIRIIVSMQIEFTEGTAWVGLRSPESVPQGPWTYGTYESPAQSDAQISTYGVQASPVITIPNGGVVAVYLALSSIISASATQTIIAESGNALIIQRAAE